MAHELRTPLSLILDPLGKVLNDSSIGENTKKYFLVMQRNAQRLYNLTNQLLDFRKIETGQLEVVKTVNDIVCHLRRIYGSFESQALENCINYEFNTSLDSLNFLYDYEKVETIFYNLLSNAFKYTPHSGKISLHFTHLEVPLNSQKRDSFIEIKIADTGKGIKLESQEHIFNMFYSERDSSGENYKSYGVGLAFTKELIELHDGAISVESKVGQGTCFTVLFPYVPVKSKIYREENEKHKINLFEVLQPVDAVGLSGDHIGCKKETSLLIIEDNDEIRNYLAAELSSVYAVYEAIDGLDGYEKACECLPDLIISDIMMPGMDGIALCRKFKSDVQTSHIPIILLTARQSEQDIIEGYETGADAYVIKPFNTAILNSQIMSLIDNRIKLKVLFGKGGVLDVKSITNNVTDEAFVNKAIKMIQDNIDDTNFNSEAFADMMKISRALLYKKIKALTDMTVHNFITTVRINKAAELLLSGDFNISEVAYKVGYTDTGNFSRSFTKVVGCRPSNYIKVHNKS